MVMRSITEPLVLDVEFILLGITEAFFAWFIFTENVTDHCFETLLLMHSRLNRKDRKLSKFYLSLEGTYNDIKKEEGNEFIIIKRNIFAWTGLTNRITDLVSPPKFNVVCYFCNLYLVCVFSLHLCLSCTIFSVSNFIQKIIRIFYTVSP